VLPEEVKIQQPSAHEIKHGVTEAEYNATVQAVNSKFKSAEYLGILGAVQDLMRKISGTYRLAT